MAPEKSKDEKLDDLLRDYEILLEVAEKERTWTGVKKWLKETVILIATTIIVIFGAIKAYVEYFKNG